MDMVISDMHCPSKCKISYVCPELEKNDDLKNL